MQFIGRRIAEARKARRISQQSLAELLGVSRAAVSLWEQGQTIPMLDKIEAIALALGVDRGWLAFGRGGDDIEELLRVMTPRQRAAWVEMGRALVASTDDAPQVELDKPDQGA